MNDLAQLILLRYEGFLREISSLKNKLDIDMADPRFEYISIEMASWITQAKDDVQYYKGVLNAPVKVKKKEVEL